jgi:hypothetical protein
VSGDRHSWFCAKCERGFTSRLAPRYYDHLCAACDPRTADERREARTAMLPPLPRRELGAERRALVKSYCLSERTSEHGARLLASQVST